MTALVLAARRPGVVDPLSQAEGVSHKCLIEIGGRPMIARVADCLAASPEIGEIIVSIDDEAVLEPVAAVRWLKATGRLRCVASGPNLFDSVRRALPETVAWPVLVTTADNALMTPEMIAHAASGFAASGADVGVALTSTELVWSKYPDGQRRPHRFADGPVSNCNIFFLKGPEALRAARAFEGGGQFGKSKLRVLQAFGFLNLLLYLSKRLTLAAVFRRISRRFGLIVAPVDLPFAEAPIDVDNERTCRIAREIVAAQAAEAEAAREGLHSGDVSRKTRPAPDGPEAAVAQW